MLDLSYFQNDYLPTQSGLEQVLREPIHYQPLLETILRFL